MAFMWSITRRLSSPSRKQSASRDRKSPPSTVSLTNRKMLSLSTFLARRVDAALGGDAMRAAWAVVVGEALHVVAQLAERCRAPGAGKPAADHDHGELAPIQRGHQTVGRFASVPRGGRIAVGHSAVHARADNA